MSRIRPTTTAWGIFLALTGGVIIMVSSGTRFNTATLTIIVLTLLGVAALVLALLPRPKPRAEVTVTRIVPDESGDPSATFSGAPVDQDQVDVTATGDSEDLATEILGAPADHPATEVIDGAATQVLGAPTTQFGPQRP